MIDGSIRVLIGDDDEMDGELTERAVRSVLPDARIDRCEDGVCCLEALQALLDDSEPRAKLVFFDFRMPRMGCIEVLESLGLQNTNDLPIVLFSSAVSPRDVDRAKELGVREYAIKPTDPEHYTQLVCRLSLQLVPLRMNGAEVC